ncbi:hypothetical protein ADK41_09925 [Streptomyces caelestis]|uniref:Uncharacterized protein n=1 Tax=Streptomyces caelestis TaxID=36816 RepID=A0A0M9X9P4_9ACTN|nr:hypothetical protein ADK41_09925 [Streptomyces caelestis]KOV25109.1 hypothetical protein ADK58_17045 [Streptomyces sp. XY152]
MSAARRPHTRGAPRPGRGAGSGTPPASAGRKVRLRAQATGPVPRRPRSRRAPHRARGAASSPPRRRNRIGSRPLRHRSGTG